MRLVNYSHPFDPTIYNHLFTYDDNDHQYYSLRGVSTPVPAQTRGLRNQFIRRGVPGVTPDNPISTLPFEKSRIFLGANRGSAGVQPGFSRGSAGVQLTLDFFSCGDFFCDPKISAFPKVKLLVKILILGVQLGFIWGSAGKNGVLTLC